MLFARRVNRKFIGASMALSPVLLMIFLLAGVGLAAPGGAPSEIEIGFVDFFSGPGATYGTMTKDTAEILVEKWNKNGGIGGARVKLIPVDESGGPDRQVTEYRRLVLDEKVDAVVGYTSSANCLAVAPVAEELRTLTVIHICGTQRLNEDHELEYVFRTSNHQVADSVMAARYLLETQPDVESIAGINEDYAWGRDSWEAFKLAMQRLKPDVKIKGALWTRIQAGEYSAEISRLLAARPDFIHSSFWGGGLVSFIRQGSLRGLFEDRRVFFSTGEQALQHMHRDMPGGVMAAPRATGGYFLEPEPDSRASQKEFVQSMKQRFGRYPDFTAYRTYQALAGLKAAYEKAIEEQKRWPSTEEVAAAFEQLSWRTPLGVVTMREDHQAVHAGLLGLTKFSPEYEFSLLDRTVVYEPDDIMPPVGVKSGDWLKTLNK